MKRFLFSLLLAFAATAPLLADDVALISLRVAKENRQRQFAIEFFESDAPQTVANFQKLARKGYYKGTAVHRAFGHTLVQMGDPLSKKKDRSVSRYRRSRLHDSSGNPAQTRQGCGCGGPPPGQDQSITCLERKPVLHLPRTHAEPRRPVHRFRQGHLGF